MERYILIITHDDLDDEIRNALNIAQKSSKKIPRKSFLAILKVQPTDESSEIIFPDKEWLCWKNCDDLDEELNIFTINNWTTLAAAINVLADVLPEIGQYFMDVLCCGKVFTHEMPEQKVEISVSLERLFRWHNAHVVFHRPHTLGSEQVRVVDKWCWWLCGSTFNDLWPFPNLKLWHGSLALSATLSFDGFELVFLGSPEQLLLDSNSHSYLKKMLLSRQISHVATSLDFLLDCEHLAVPPFLYSPVKFLLQIPQGKQTFEVCHSFIEFFETRPTYCMVFSLAFTCSGVKQDSQKYDFEAWVNGLQSGKVTDVCPQTCLPDDSPHFTFVLYYDGSVCQSRNSLVAHLLVDPGDLNVEPLLPHVLAPDLPVDDGDSRVDWNRLIPQLDKHFVCPDSPSKNEEPATAASHSVDPADWPERRYLLLKELKTQKQGSSLDSLAPPTSNRKVIEMKLSDLSKYFDSNGMPKSRKKKKNHSPSKKENVTSPLHLISGGQGRYPVKVLQTFQEMQNSVWPHLLQCQYHDIYFNHSSWKEEQELSCNRLKEQFVLEETSSSNPNGNKPWLVCTAPRTKQSVNHKKPPHPKLRKCKSMSSYSSYLMHRRTSPRKAKDSLQAKVDCRVPRPRSHSKENEPEREPPILVRQDVQPITSRTGTKRPDTVVVASVPLLDDSVRRSPRFKQKQVLRSSTNSSIPRNADDLSEKHKKKLREAVALALESEGIMLTSPSFKLCGRRLFNVCKAFVKDILGKGSTSALMRKIAAAHVKQVIEFERIKS